MVAMPMPDVILDKCRLLSMPNNLSLLSVFLGTVCVCVSTLYADVYVCACECIHVYLSVFMCVCTCVYL